MKKFKNKLIIHNLNMFFSSFNLIILKPLKNFFVLIYRLLKITFLSVSRNPKSFICEIFFFIFKWWQRFLLLFFLGILLLFPFFILISEKIDDNPDFSGEKIAKNQMQSIQTAQALIDREVVTYGWKANLPFIFPSSFLDNMPSFQIGIIEALATFTDSYSHEKLQRSSEMLSYPVDIWYLNFSSYFKPVKPTQSVYKKAMALLLSYNEDLKNGLQPPLTASDLNNVIHRIKEDLRHCVFKIDEKLSRDEYHLIDFSADNIFYQTKGKLYANALLLRDLKKDYAHLIETPEMEIAFNDVIDSLIKAFQYNPRIIFNGKVDSFLIPSHLAVQGFYVMQVIDNLMSLQKFFYIERN